MMQTCRIIVFAKAPVAGQAKTRLIPALGPEGAAALAARMLEHTLKQAHAAGLGPVELCCAPHADHPAFAGAARRGTLLSEQGDGTLGERMTRALARSLKSGVPALLIGTDAPDLNPAVLSAAAHALKEHDAVCVPAFDGGYALIGLRRPCPMLFEDIAWSTAAVMQHTRHRARAAGIILAELPPVADIDEAADLIHLPRDWLP